MPFVFTVEVPHVVIQNQLDCPIEPISSFTIKNVFLVYTRADFPHLYNLIVFGLGFFWHVCKRISTTIQNGLILSESVKTHNSL